MHTVELGRTGHSVARIGLGAMPLSLEGRPRRQDGISVIRRAVDLGVNLIDTADVYCRDDRELGHNERLIREALEDTDHGEVIAATKGGLSRPGGRWDSDARPLRLLDACQDSLRALGVERIDLYQLHAPDPDVPLERSVEALAQLREKGRIRWVGLSNVSVEELEVARSIVPVTSVQNRLNPWDRRAEASGLLARCHEERITFIAYSPLGGKRSVDRIHGSRALKEVAGRLDATPAEVVLAWVLDRSPSLVAIPGASRVESVESSVRAQGLELDEHARARLEEVFGRAPF